MAKERELKRGTYKEAIQKRRGYIKRAKLNLNFFCF
jgi:hypothetical protein